MALGDNYPLNGQVRVSDAENREHQTTLFAKRIVEIPNDLQNRYEYNASSQVEYAGYAPKGLASNADGWLLHKFTYTDSLVTLKQSAYGNWDNRASETYE